MQEFPTVTPPSPSHPASPAATLAMALAMALAATHGEAQAPAPDPEETEPDALGMEVLLQDTVTWDGQALPAYPESQPQITIVRLTVPPGAALPEHRHPIINGGVLLSGELTVRTESGQEKRLQAGDALLEVVDTWHFGRNTGTEPAVAIVFYVGAEGLPTTVLREAAGLAEAPMLNSERIAAVFGSYGVELLHQEGRSRESNLYSTHGPDTVTRTLAVVDLPSQVPESLGDAHDAILGGASIGATLKAAGWTVDKELLWDGTLDAPSADGWLGELMRLDGPEPLAAQLYRLELSRGEERFAYASIAEIHHPEHQEPGERAPSETGNGLERLAGGPKPGTDRSVDPCDIGFPVTAKLQ